MRKLESIIAERAHLDADDRDLRSRTDAKEERVAVEETLNQLAKELVETKRAWLDQLNMPERLHDAIHDAQMIKSPIAKNRQMRIVRRELRDSDWERIGKVLSVLSKHGALPATDATPVVSLSEASVWVARLLSGPQGQADLFSEFPDADRTHLRQLIRNVEKAPVERRAKAESKLADAVAALLRG